MFDFVCFFILFLKNCVLSVREMLDFVMKELIDKGYIDVNDVNVLGFRVIDGKIWKFCSIFC